MKFDNFYKMVVNEANEFEDVSELAGEGIGGAANAGGIEDDLTDVLGSEGIDVDVRPESRGEKIDYLIKNLPIIAPKNRNKTPEQLEAKAAWLVDNDMFDPIFDAHEGRERTPDEVEPDFAAPGTKPPKPEELESLPTYQQHKKEQAQAQEDIPDIEV